MLSKKSPFMTTVTKYLSFRLQGCRNACTWAMMTHFYELQWGLSKNLGNLWAEELRSPTGSGDIYSHIYIQIWYSWETNHLLQSCSWVWIFWCIYIYDWLYIYKVQLKLTDQLFILKYCNPVSEHHGKRWIKRPLLRPARANAKSDGNFWTTSPHTGDDDEYLVQLSISEAQVFRLN